MREKRERIAARLKQQQTVRAKLQKQRDQLAVALRAQGEPGFELSLWTRLFGSPEAAPDTKGRPKTLRSTYDKVVDRLRREDATVARLRIQLAQAVAVVRMQEEQERALREAFTVFDIYKTGTIEEDDFLTMMSSLQPDYDKTTLKAAFAAIDTKGQGKLDLNVFTKAVMTSTFNPFTSDGAVVDELDLKDISAALIRASRRQSKL